MKLGSRSEHFTPRPPRSTIFSTTYREYVVEPLNDLWGQGESSRPSLRETRDKRPLGWDPDRSWCDRHTTEYDKAFLFAAHDSIDWVAAHSYAAADFLGAMATTKNGLHWCGDDTSFCPGPYPTAACLEFHVGSKLGWTFHLALVCEKFDWLSAWCELLETPLWMWHWIFGFHGVD